MGENRIQTPYYPLPVTGERGKKGPSGKGSPANSLSFASVLEKAKGELHFSAHARQRLQSRGIELSPGEVDKLKEAVEKAAAKGCRSSLLLYRDMAFVAGIPGRTIITALDGEAMKKHVFTNIDSAVIVE